MKKLFIVTCLMQWAVATRAQEEITVRPSDISDFITKNGYKYPSFKKAIVYFKDAAPGGGKLNYNYLLQTMQFIGDKGDTLVIADETGIDHVSLGSDTFYYDNGFFERLAATSSLRLAVAHSLKPGATPQKLGAFGMPTATQNVVSEGATRSRANVLALDVNEVYVFKKKTAYYISKDNKPFQELNKKNIARLFPGQADRIGEFMKQHQTNLNKEKDVVEVFAFASGLLGEQGSAR